MYALYIDVCVYIVCMYIMYVCVRVDGCAYIVCRDIYLSLYNYSGGSGL